MGKIMSTLPDIPLSQEASGLIKRLMPRIRNRLQEAHNIPVAVLLWGPGINSHNPLTKVRLKLRSELRKKGHAAFFSEELCDPALKDSIRLQQLAQAQEFDLVVSTPCTPGSIGEIHDFAADRRVSGRTLVFINREHMDGYSPKSLSAISTIYSCHLEYYPNEGNTGIIYEVALQEVQRIREMKYILAGRY
jgi:hypothetical protein